MGHVEAVNALLDGNAKVDSQRMDKPTPLHLATAHGHAEVVKALLDRNAEV